MVGGVSKVKDDIRSRTGGLRIIGGINVGKSRVGKEMWPEGGKKQACYEGGSGGVWDFAGGR